MLQKATNNYDFSRYILNRPLEIAMGYEYENYDPQCRSYDYPKRIELTQQMRTLVPNHFKVEYEPFGGRQSGCEIKSVIAPLSIHKLLAHKLLANVPLNLSENVITNAGIHVNIDSSGAAHTVWKKVFTFLHERSEHDNFFKLSKRTRPNFDQNCPQRPTTLANMNRQWFSDHYNIINWQNTERFEFRLFSAHPTLLLPALEMADSLFKHAHDVDVITMASWRSYINRFKKYEHIKEHCIATLDRPTS